MFKLFVTVRREELSEVEFKKLILIVDPKISISMLKRQVEKEFVDLYPFEDPLVCSKLEDSYGYALSNVSLVEELLVNGDRVMAIPISKKHDGQDAISAASSVQENLEMLGSMIRTVAVKLSNSPIDDPEIFDSIAHLFVPLGFVDAKEMLVPLSRIVLKWAMSEHFAVFANPARDSVLKHLVLVLTFWLRHPLMADTFFSSTVLEAVWFFLKSERFARALKSVQITHVLIGISKDERVPAQVKSRILQVIKYLSNDAFLDTFVPKTVYRPASKRNKPVSRPGSKSELDQKPPGPAVPDNRRTASRQYNFSDEDHEDFVKKLQSPADAQLSSKDKNRGSAGAGPGRDSEQMLRAPQRTAFFGEMDESRKKVTSRGIMTLQQVDLPTKPFDHQPSFGGGDPQETLYLEYVSLLEPSNTKELLSFAVSNLAKIIDDCIFSILQNKPMYLKLLGLLDIHMTGEDRDNVKKILLCLAKHLTEERAVDGVRDFLIEKILKAFNRSGHDFHEVYSALVFSHIIKSNYDVRVNSLVEMMKTPYLKLQDLALKIMKDISRPHSDLRRDYAPEFENHIRFILESSLSKDRSVQQVNSILEVVANLCITEYLCPEVVHHSGIETLLLHLREKANLEGQRLAARGLLNIGAKSRENKLRIVSELSYEIRAMHRGELDAVVRSYIATLVQARAGSEQLQSQEVQQ